MVCSKMMQGIHLLACNAVAQAFVAWAQKFVAYVPQLLHSVMIKAFKLPNALHA